MGFFSWKTQDTDRSIANHYSDIATFPVTMIDDKGNKWTETDYEGYGEFAGKDFYELLAEMNGLGSDRGAGITLAYSGKPYKSPNLNEDPNAEWIDIAPEDCPDQGYFYDDETIKADRVNRFKKTLTSR
jgi:hypothetical protein